MFMRGKRALQIFPDIKEVKVVFREKYASGYSTKSWKTKAGGASKLLDIVVTEEELWVKSNFIFAGFASYYDLVHKISRSNISNIERKPQSIIVDFINSENENKQLVLVPRKLDELYNALSVK